MKFVRLAVFVVTGWLLNAASHAFERTEVRAPCLHSDPDRQALFGDLHVHSSYSHDAYVSSVRATP